MILLSHVILALSLTSSAQSIQFPFLSSSNSNQKQQIATSSSTSLNKIKLKQTLHLSLKDRTIPTLFHNHSPTYHTTINSLGEIEELEDEGIDGIKFVENSVWKPNSNQLFQQHRFNSYQSKKLLRSTSSFPSSSSLSSSVKEPEPEPLEWNSSKIKTPNLKDVSTISNLAKMTSNAYASPERYNLKDWYTIDGGFNVVSICFFVYLFNFCCCFCWVFGFEFLDKSERSEFTTRVKLNYELVLFMLD